MDKRFIVAIPIMLALMATQPLYAQQSSELPLLDKASGSFTCYEGQTSHLTWLKRINTSSGKPDLFPVAFDDGDSIVFASDSTGHVLATSKLDALTITIEPSSKQYRLAERTGIKRMQIADLFVGGKNHVTVTGAPAGQPLWLMKFSPCPDAEITGEHQASEAATPETGLLGINNVGSVAQNIADVIANLELPDTDTGATLAAETVTPRQIAMLPAATTAPTEIPTATTTAVATATPTATVQAPSIPATNPHSPTASNDEAEPLLALMLAIAALTVSIQELLYVARIGVTLLAGLLVLPIVTVLALYHRYRILAVMAQIGNSRFIRKSRAVLRRYYGQASRAVQVQFTVWLRQLRDMADKRRQ